MALWIEGINLDVSWSWAARMARCLTGPAKTLAESIPMEELRAKPWTWMPVETPEGEATDAAEATAATAGGSAACFGYGGQ